MLAIVKVERASSSIRQPYPLHSAKLQFLTWQETVICWQLSTLTRDKALPETETSFRIYNYYKRSIDSAIRPVNASKNEMVEQVYDISTRNGSREICTLLRHI